MLGKYHFNAQSDLDIIVEKEVIEKAKERLSEIPNVHVQQRGNTQYTIKGQAITPIHLVGTLDRTQESRLINGIVYVLPIHSKN